MFFYFTVSTKEKTTLKNFLVFFSKIHTLTFKFFKLKQKKNKHKVVTILKSPHVNKTAQEQFEFKFFTRQILLYSQNPFLSFIMLKRILKRKFPGVKLKLLYTFDKKKQNKILLLFLNPNKIKLENETQKEKIKNYFFLFDSYGEICLQNFKS